MSRQLSNKIFSPTIGYEIGHRPTLLQCNCPKMAAVDKANLNSLHNASSNFPSITGVQNLNAGICESNKGLFSTVVAR